MEIALKLRPGEGLSAEEQKAIDDAQEKIELDEKVSGFVRCQNDKILPYVRV